MGIRPRQPRRARPRAVRHRAELGAAAGGPGSARARPDQERQRQGRPRRGHRGREDRLCRGVLLPGRQGGHQRLPGQARTEVAGEVTAEATTSQAARLAELIRDAGSVVALTGAGISVPSGIPDFRSPGSGLWENVDPMEVAHIDAWRADPERFWHFYGSRFQALREKQPNGAHRVLVELEQRGCLDAVITQNIDRLHRRAGTRELVEVHGTIDHSSCLDCGAQYPLEDVQRRLDESPISVPACDCGRPLKPDVVLFGEFLPDGALERAYALAAGADLLLCVGSSLEVHPIAQLPGATRQAGGRIAIVTAGPTPWDAHAALKLDGDVVSELEAVLAAL